MRTIKKVIFTAIIAISFILITGTLSAGATVAGVVPYGDFDYAGSPNVAPYGWNHYEGWEAGFATSTDCTHSGRFSLKTVINEPSAAIPRATISGLGGWGYFEVGATYELSIWVNIPKGSDSKGAYLLPTAYTSATGSSSSLRWPSDADVIYGDTNGEWVQTKVVFTAKREVGPLKSLFIRCNAGSVGTIYWDDLELHRLDSNGQRVDESIDYNKEVADGNGTDIISNGSFETLNSKNEAVGWSVHGGWGGPYVSLSGADAYSGKNAIKLSGDVVTNAMQNCKVTAGEKYVFAAYVKTFTYPEGIPILTFNFADKNNNMVDSITTRRYAETDGRWMRIYYSFTVPTGATKLSVYLKKYGSGDVYYDNVLCKRANDTPMLVIDTDNDTTFYYTEWGQGTATVTLNTATFNIPDGSIIEFCITDGVNSYGHQAHSVDADSIDFTFNLSDLPVIGTEYNLQATLKYTSGGDAVYTGTRRVYRYDRPTAIGEDGTYILEDGTPFYPHFGSHVISEEILVKAAQAGINVVTGGGYDVESTKAWLDTCYYKYGIRVMINLYSENSLPAGNYVNKKRTTKIVTALRDHPGVFAWMIQDEPFLQDSNNPDKVREDLFESYKLIRDLDPHHPTFMTADIYSKTYYVDVGNYCDLISPDDYALGSGRAITSVYGNIKSVNDAVRGRKPVYALLQTFTYGVMGGKDLLPTINELRNMIYQSLWAGSDAIGYYSFYEFTNPPWELSKTELYPGLVAFAKEELSIAHNGFNKGTYLSEDITGSVWYRTWRTGNKIYVLALNRQSSQQTIDISIPFKGTTVRAVGGGDISNADLRDETLSVSLEGNGAALYSIDIGTLPQVPTTMDIEDLLGVYGGFEESTSGNAPVGWVHYEGFDEAFTASSECTHSGSLALKTEISSTVQANPDIVPRAKLSKSSFGDFEIGTEYEVSVWINIPDTSEVSAAYLLMRTYTDTGTTVLNWPGASSIVSGNTNGKWVRHSVRFTAADIRGINEIYIRCNSGSKGIIYWDDLTITKVNSSNAVFGFYDSSDREIEELTAGTIKARFNTGAQLPAGTKLVMALYEGKKMIDVCTDTKDDSSVLEVSIPVTQAQVESGLYTIKVMFWDSIGSISPIYQYIKLS